MSRFARFLPYVLAASLLLNVFLLGWGATRFARRHHGARPSPEREISPAARALWEGRAPRFREQRGAIDARRQAVAEALRREPFDGAALDAALLALRTATAEGQLELHQTIGELARQLPSEERQRLAKSRWMLEGPHGPRSGH